MREKFKGVRGEKGEGKGVRTGDRRKGKEGDSVTWQEVKNRKGWKTKEKESK